MAAGLLEAIAELELETEDGALTGEIQWDEVARCVTSTYNDVANALSREIVRIKLSAVCLVLTGEQTRDVSPLLTKPLYAVAATLGLTEQVEREVDATLQRARRVLLARE